MSWWSAHPYWRRTIKILLGILVVLVALAAGGIALLASPWFSEHLGEWISQRSGREVTFGGKVEAHWGHEPRFVFHQIKVANATWASEPYFFAADRLEVSIRPWELLHGRLVLPELIVETPVLALEKDAQGHANWDFTQNPQAVTVKAVAPTKRTQMPIIGQLTIDNGQLAFHDAEKKINITLDVSTATGESGKNTPIILSGKGDYKAAPFQIDFHGASVLQLRETKEPYPFTLKLRVGDTSADADGTVEDPFKMEALDINLKLSGASAAHLFPLTGIALPPTPPYHVAGRLTYDAEIWHFEQFKGQMGSSDLSGDVAWHTDRKPPWFEGNFVSQNLDMRDLAGFVGAHKKPADENRVIPDEPIDVSRMKAMDADVTFRGEHVRTPELLDDFLMKVHLQDAVLKLAPLSFGIGKGNITANVTVDGKKEPPFTSLDVVFRRMDLQRLFQPLVKQYGEKNVSAGLLGGKAVLKGRGKSLQEMLGTSEGEIGMGMEGGRLSHLLLELIGLDIFRAAGLMVTGDQPVDIRCMVGDFGVTDGLMQTKEFLIDTEVTTLRGEGQVNLKNEAMRLRIVAYPKHPSPLSARSPIVITGTLKHPSIGIDAAALAARGGVAAALGALLTPVGSLLAFIEPGLGEDSHCAAFLHEMEQKTGGAIPKNTKLPPLPEKNK
ncbi:MAG: AsmA family protein [Alphaproteobacteria bacterium]|nr:AsmA family protein [Alphaproteobacteria bacterium]